MLAKNVARNPHFSSLARGGGPFSIKFNCFFFVCDGGSEEGDMHPSLVTTQLKQKTSSKAL